MAQDHALEDDVFTGRIDLALWRKVLMFARPYRKHLTVLAMLGALVGVFDISYPLITGGVIDSLRAHEKTGAPAHIGWYLALNTAMMFCFVACIYTFIVVAGRITTGVSHDIRRDAFARLQELPFSFYDRKAVGWLMARLTSDCGSLSRIMGWALLDICWGVIVLILVSGAMFWLNWRVALVVLLIVPPLAFVSRYFQLRLLLTSRALRKANSQTTAAFNEGILGVRTTKSMVREQRNLEEFSVLADSMYAHAVSNQLYSAVFVPMVLSICSIGIGLALWRGGVEVTWGGLTVGQLVAFLQYAAFLQHPAQELANTITMIQGAQASAERVQGLLDADPEIVDSPEVQQRLRQFSSPGPVAGKVARHLHEGIAPDGYSAAIESIEFREVSFWYKPGQTVLRNFNLAVRAGETIALVGPTGGGKTTIVGLACRFYEPTSGQILINGLDYRRRSLKWLQSNLGMVLQQPHLFSGTVRQNIRYGRLDATDEQVEQAARQTCAHEFIMEMENGYDTQVGEGGNKLSTGQKQLIALARAIIADPQIFVMDEATSSVDTHTERAIQSAVERVLQDRISFVIAHRLSTIRSADRILLIDAGQIVEQGTHHDLLARRGRYYELYTNQFTHEREEQMLHYT
ncbi:ABC transporter ATP-binding protein [Fontivita pretiosa]|uniref:ABC transporter ATP-binding protein n=1 Tax=Fontivita pretiosa TaxID=2989684 RepID=UPI003D1684CE